jgi:hypothetical protein
VLKKGRQGEDGTMTLARIRKKGNQKKNDGKKTSGRLTFSYILTTTKGLLNKTGKTTTIYVQPRGRHAVEERRPARSGDGETPWFGARVRTSCFLQVSGDVGRRRKRAGTSKSSKQGKLKKT